ncbi:hypothetical protein AB0L63_27060 [Nocardia sp. NPDC051990]|uniref:hypothetical protein n=1 Tax=Nocardia sp. NPDC051990 TaxID=3155285 RepID=UPI0034464663
MFLIGPGVVPNGKHRELNWMWWQQVPGDVCIVVTAALIIAGVVQLLWLQGPDAESGRSTT